MYMYQIVSYWKVGLIYRCLSVAGPSSVSYLLCLPPTNIPEAGAYATQRLERDRDRGRQGNTTAQEHIEIIKII